MSVTVLFFQSLSSLLWSKSEQADGTCKLGTHRDERVRPVADCCAISVITGAPALVFYAFCTLVPSLPPLTLISILDPGGRDVVAHAARINSSFNVAAAINATPDYTHELGMNCC